MKTNLATGVIDEISERLKCLILTAPIPELRYLLNFVNAKYKSLESCCFN